MAISIAKIPDSIFREYSNKNAEMLEEAILNGILLPDNATNGDVIKAVFPNIDFYEGEVDKIGGLISFYARDEHEEKRQRVIITADWWNAPYKRGDTNGNS